jgi:zinc protease
MRGEDETLVNATRQDRHRWPKPGHPPRGLAARGAWRPAALLLACALAGACARPAAAQGQARDWPSERPPHALTPRDITFPPYQVQTLPNGLQVVAVLHHEQPAVSMRLLVRTGSAADPKGKLGLDHLLASLLDQGTATRSAQEVNDAIDFIGGAVNTGAGSDLTYINMVVMKDSFETGMRMLDEMTEHPAFSFEEIDRQRQQIASGLRVSLEDPEYLADAVFDRLVYGAHPYGLPDNGTPESLGGVTRADLLAFHEKYFVPNNAILAIVGDVTADEAFTTARAVFGRWASRDVPRERFLAPPASARRVIVVDKPDAVQTEVRVGHIGIPRNHPDYMALNLAVRILGGEGSNRLHQVLRTERGLTYGAQAKMDTLKDSGDIEAETNTRTDATGEVLRLIVDEFWRLQRERVSDSELAAAKAYMTGSFPLTIETPDAIAAQVLNVVFFGLPLEELQTFRDRVNAVTVDDIERVARFYLKPDAVSVVLVGNAAAFTPQLRRIGFNRYETVTLDNLDLLAVDFKKTAPGGGAGRLGHTQLPNRAAADRGAGAVIRIARYQPPAAAPVPPPARGASLTAKTLLDDVIAAKGGLAAMRALKTIVATSAATMSTPTGPVESKTTTYLEYPNRVRVETTMPQGTQTQVYDGTHGWVRDPFGLHEVPELGLREMEASLRRDTVSALLAAANGDLQARLLPDVVDADGHPRHALELSGPSFDPLVLQIEPDTHLIAKQTYTVHAPGEPTIEEVFSDYRPVNGITVAFLAEVRTGGRSVVQRRLGTIQTNTSIDTQLFTRPVP